MSVYRPVINIVHDATTLGEVLDRDAVLLLLVQMRDGDGAVLSLDGALWSVSRTGMILSGGGRESWYVAACSTSMRVASSPDPRALLEIMER